MQMCTRFIDWRIWIECEQPVWSEQRWPNRTKQGCSTQHVHISYNDSVKAVKKRPKSISIPATPGVVGLHSKYTYSGFGQSITLTRSALARDSPNRSCPRAYAWCQTRCTVGYFGVYLCGIDGVPERRCTAEE